MDIVDRATRSRIMRAIRRKDTKPEMLIRRGLFKLGRRFRIDDKRLPGRPDVVLRKHNAAILVNGCFWHHHHSCANGNLPSTRTTFWKLKLEANVQRDKRNVAALLEQGWRVAVVWECALTETTLPHTLSSIDKWLDSADVYLEVG